MNTVLKVLNKLSNGIFKIQPDQTILSQEFKDCLTLGKKFINISHYNSYLKGEGHIFMQYM